MLKCESVYNHDFMYFAYRGRLMTLIGLTKCCRYNPIHDCGSDILDEVDAYFRTYWFDEDLDPVHMQDLGKLFSEAVSRYSSKYKRYSFGLAPGNIDSYMEVIGLCNLDYVEVKE